MFMLRKLAEESGKVPAIFTDGDCYRKLGHIILSTSTLQVRACRGPAPCISYSLYSVSCRKVICKTCCGGVTAAD